MGRGPIAADWFRNLLRRGTVVDFSDAGQVSDAFRRADTREKVLLCARFAEPPAKEQLDNDAWDTIRELVAPKAESSAQDWVNWGHFLEFEFHKYEEAEMAFRKALELQPTDANAWNRLAMLLHFKLRRYGDAEAAYGSAIKFAPQSSLPVSYLALLFHHRLEKPSEAESLYRRALELDPNRPWAWTAFGNLLRSPLGRLSEAEDAYRTALRLDPKYAYAWRSLAALLKEELEKYVEAEKAFRKSLEYDSSSALAWRGLANLLFFDLRRYADADTAYERALQLDPNDGDSLNNRGLLLADCLGDPDKAIAALRRAIVLEPDALPSRYNLVAVLRDQTQDRAEAEAVALLLPKSETGTIGAALLLHTALFAAYDNNWDEARRYLNDALTMIADVPAIPPDTYPAWIRTTAVIIHLGFGSAFLELLKERGDHQRLRPWYEAIRARLRGDRKYLRNSPAEVHEVAGSLYDAIDLRLRVLPEATRRWSPHAAGKGARAKGKKRGRP